MIDVPSMETEQRQRQLAQTLSSRREELEAERQRVETAQAGLARQAQELQAERKQREEQMLAARELEARLRALMGERTHFRGMVTALKSQLTDFTTTFEGIRAPTTDSAASASLSKPASSPSHNASAANGDSTASHEPAQASAISSPQAHDAHNSATSSPKQTLPPLAPVLVPAAASLVRVNPVPPPHPPSSALAPTSPAAAPVESTFTPPPAPPPLSSPLVPTATSLKVAEQLVSVLRPALSMPSTAHAAYTTPAPAATPPALDTASALTHTRVSNTLLGRFVLLNICAHACCLSNAQLRVTTMPFYRLSCCDASWTASSRKRSAQPSSSNTKLPMVEW